MDGRSPHVDNVGLIAKRSDREGVGVVFFQYLNPAEVKFATALHFSYFIPHEVERSVTGCEPAVPIEISHRLYLLLYHEHTR